MLLRGIGLGAGLVLTLSLLGSARAGDQPSSDNTLQQTKEAPSPATGDGWIVLSVASCVHGGYANAHIVLAREQHFHHVNVRAFPNSPLFHQDFVEGPQSEEAGKLCDGDSLGGQVYTLRAPPGVYHFLDARTEGSFLTLNLSIPGTPIEVRAGHTVYLGEFSIVPRHKIRDEYEIPWSDRLARDMSIAQSKKPSLSLPADGEDMVPAIIAATKQQ